MDPSHFLRTKAPWADVRDIGEVHAVCLEKEAAGGERIIVTAGTYTWFEFGTWLLASMPTYLTSFAFS